MTEELVEKTSPIQSIEGEEDVPEYYSSVARVISGIGDVTILFGRVQPVGIGTGKAVMGPVCSLHMSPASAKSLLLLLRQQLQNYEEKWGEIPVHPEVKDKYGEKL
jgi:hypothetical protein